MTALFEEGSQEERDNSLSRRKNKANPLIVVLAMFYSVCDE